uniref:Calponin-homology (CH) domain-containing protein n=1 Tax=Electrophorus electricus TaxID=8005 RepID=A0AAY5ETV6_ELEEL
MVRDGVLLCQLLKNLKQNTIHLKEMSHSFLPLSSETIQILKKLGW